MSEEWEKWVGPADDLIDQAYYRILGMISFHAPISEAIKAIEYLAKTKRGGTLTYWGTTFVPGIPWRAIPVEIPRRFKVYSWEDIEVYPGVFMDMWIYGSERSENTAYVRKRWYNLYMIEDFVRRFVEPIKIV